MTEFAIRHYVPEKDLVSLSKMLTEIEAVDHDGEDTSEEYLRGMLEWPNFDAEQNVWVAEVNGNFVGYGQVFPRSDNPSTIYVVVHPTYRRKGLGSTLLALALSRAQQAESKTVYVYANDRNAASNHFLNHHEFAVAGSSGVMVAPANHLLPAEIPSGYSIRRFPELEKSNPAVVVEALDQCYKDMVGHHQNVTSADRFLEYYGEEGIHLLFDENETLIGICSAKPQGKTEAGNASDLLDAPGLIKEYRGRGFQLFFTLAVMNWLREKGTRPITLEYWGDDEETIELYRGLGFEWVNKQLTFQKEVA